MVIALLEERGYFCYPSRGSRGIDVIALAPKDTSMPHIGLEVGTKNKSAKKAFEKMRSEPNFPGMVLLVVRKRLKKNRISFRWHSAGGRGFDTLEAALESLKAA